MPQRQSAGLLMYRSVDSVLEVFIAHPGGPRYAERDKGVWSIPKGEFEANETPLETALREFQEETGLRVPDTAFHSLGTIQQKGGKIVHAWAFDGQHVDVSNITSNRIKIEWPPKSSRQIEIPEIDRAQYFPIAIAKAKLKARQVPLIDRLEAVLRTPRHDSRQQTK